MRDRPFAVSEVDAVSDATSSAHMVEALDRLGEGLLRIALWAALAVALGGLGIACLDKGPHAVRRLILVTFVLVPRVAGVLSARRTIRLLRVRPSVLIGIALLDGAAIAADGAWRSPLTMVIYTAPALAAIVGSPSLWVRAAVIVEAGYVVGLNTSGHGLQWLRAHDHVDEVAANLTLFMAAAAVLLAATHLFRRYLARLPVTLADVRSGAPAFTPALHVLLGTGAGAMHPMLSPAAPRDLLALLTAAELAIAEQLSGGLAPKQIAHKTGTSLHTVRTHLKRIKRKLGVRTLPQLVAVVQAARSDAV